MSTTLVEDVAAGRAPDLLPLTVDQLELMIENGILSEGDPVELIEGMLVRKDRAPVDGDLMAHGIRHATVLRALEHLLRVVEPLGCSFQAQLPVVLSPSSAPEPDLAVLRGTRRTYASHHPGPAEVLIAIEVADHSLAYDRMTKQRLYARAGIARYVIVNLRENQLELYQEPLSAEGRYARRVDYLPGQTLRLTLAADATFDLEVACVLQA